MNLAQARNLLKQHAAAGRQIPVLVAVDFLADMATTAYTDAGTASKNLIPESVQEPGEMPAVVGQIVANLFEIDAAGLAAWGALETPKGALVFIPKVQVQA